VGRDRERSGPDDRDLNTARAAAASEPITKEKHMWKLTLAAGITALAIALPAPVALAQVTPNSNPAPPAASPRGYEMGSGMTYDTGRGTDQRQAPGPGDYGPGMMGGPGQALQPGNYGPGMMDGHGQGPDGNGPGVMSGYGVGWMGGYGGVWVPILLLLVVAGLAIWFIRQKTKPGSQPRPR
jgi:hypothetical protein